MAADEPFPGGQPAEEDQPEPGELPEGLGRRAKLDVGPLHGTRSSTADGGANGSTDAPIRFRQSSWNWAR